MIARKACLLALLAAIALPRLCFGGGGEGQPAMSAPASTKRVCPAGSVSFHGRCVDKDQCCEESLCPAGTVFEFVREPACVPCSDAETQAGASFCAQRTASTADSDLNRTYKSLLAQYPEQETRLKGAERAWIAFRDKFCEMAAAPYDGGSKRGEVLSHCLATETKRQSERLTELLKEWTQGHVRIPSSSRNGK
jgi:uncharacterized protein YecT (DUF1311 family)